MYRTLDAAEEKEFRDWAREFHLPGLAINQLWHPVVREECEKIDREHGCSSVYI